MIPVQNVYHMLAYAFRILQNQGYKDIKTEDFENSLDLCAAILDKGLKYLIKRGLGRDYISYSEQISAIKGKIDISSSIKYQTQLQKQLICTYDDFSENSYLNRILKTTVFYLLSIDISKETKKSLRKSMVFFSNVELLDFNNISWNLQYNRNNQTYHLLISICYMIYKSHLQTQENGNVRLIDFFDEQTMPHLYEKFILEYYRTEFPKLKVEPSRIKWQLDNDFDFMLPVMQSDITISYEGKILIIDAKYYSDNTTSRYDSVKLHSGNLYQIFTYVKNKTLELKTEPTNVSGLLLYAKTDKMIQPDVSYQMSGNTIGAKNLDLNTDFKNISQTLNSIVNDYFQL